MRVNIIISVAVAVCVGLMLMLARLYQGMLAAYEQSGSLALMDYSWVLKLLLNMVGYATILLPGFIIYKYLDRTKYFEKLTNPNRLLHRFLFTCFGEPGERLPEHEAPDAAAGPPGLSGPSGPSGSLGPLGPLGPRREALELAFCCIGLMGTYLVWGLLQEKIMTRDYIMPDGSLVRFNDSQFLVFINRLSAFVLSALALRWRPAPAMSAPLYKFSYCALTNIVSAWCQYEALKYVSFPTQVLSKSCKVIPVMMMGKLVSGNKYAPYEYVTAGLISFGMALFMLGSRDDYAVSTVTTMSGLALLALYMVCDSFTSVWQGALFARYRCSATRMLCAVSLFSCLLTAGALAQQPATRASLAMLQLPMFAADCVCISLSSALGQLMIYRTISSFGPIVFTIIMTVRQALSILLSCVVYGHVVSGAGGAGVLLVFAAILARVYCRQRLRTKRAQPL